MALTTTSKTSWISILIGVLIVAGVAAVALVAGSAYWISRHVQTQSASPESAAEEFDREHARFAGQLPVVEISGGDNPVARRVAVPEGGEARRSGTVGTLHVRVYDPADGKLLRADFPFWIIRAAKSIPFLPGMGALTMEELERQGPGLLVTGQGESGERILVWTD